LAAPLEASTLYRCVQEHLETWLANAATVTTTARDTHVREGSRQVATYGLEMLRFGPLGWYFRTTTDLISKTVTAGWRGLVATCPSEVNAQPCSNPAHVNPDRFAVGALIAATCPLAGAQTPLSRIPKL
jgi:hypothetical protein